MFLSTLRYGSPKDRKRPSGIPRTTWLRKVESDLQSANIGRFSAWRRAQDRRTWEHYAPVRGLRLTMRMMTMTMTMMTHTQEAQLSQSDHATHNASWNLINCCHSCRKNRILKRLAVSERPFRALEVVGIVAIRYATYQSLLVVCSNDDSIWQHFARHYHI